MSFKVSVLDLIIKVWDHGRKYIRDKIHNAVNSGKNVIFFKSW